MLSLRSAPDKAGAGHARFALWSLGFRPLYLLAAGLAAAAVPLWAAECCGYLPFACLRDPALHRHEMLFGYTTALVAGFLFTAVRNRTGQPTPSGGPLAAYAALWLCGRVLVLTQFEIASAAIHALTVGAIGAMTVGMMTRTARGHTGRPLRADASDSACFLLGQLAALARVFGAIALPGADAATLAVSAACWSAARAIYCVRYWPILTPARVDGKPGSRPVRAAAAA
jgi:uncharacterized protein involved in response to NO